MVFVRAPDADEVREYYSLNERVYEKFAPFYDVVVSPVRRLRRQVVTLSGAPARSKVVDIATGTGEQACAFAAMGHAVVGIDISDAMLRRAEKKAHAGNPRFFRGDATRLPFPSADFDLACISFALHEMPPSVREQTLCEMRRVTKPEGRVVIVDYGLPQNPVASVIAYHAVKLYERDRFAEFIRADLRAEIERAGIRVEREMPMLFGVVRILTGCPVEKLAPPVSVPADAPV